MRRHSISITVLALAGLVSACGGGDSRPGAGHEHPQGQRQVKALAESVRQHGQGNGSQKPALHLGVTST